MKKVSEFFGIDTPAKGKAKATETYVRISSTDVRTYAAGSVEGSRQGWSKAPVPAAAQAAAAGSVEDP